MVVGFVSPSVRSAAGGEGDVTQLRMVVGEMMVPLLLGIVVWALGVLPGHHRRTNPLAVHRESTA